MIFHRNITQLSTIEEISIFKHLLNCSLILRKINEEHSRSSLENASLIFFFYSPREHPLERNEIKVWIYLCKILQEHVFAVPFCIANHKQSVEILRQWQESPSTNWQVLQLRPIKHCDLKISNKNWYWHFTEFFFQYSPFSANLPATTDPALPAPTMIKSNSELLVNGGIKSLAYHSWSTGTIAKFSIIGNKQTTKQINPTVGCILFYKMLNSSNVFFREID